VSTGRTLGRLTFGYVDIRDLLVLEGGGAICPPPSCGNGLLEPGEECDSGDLNADRMPGACRTDHTIAADIIPVFEPEIPDH